MLGKQLKHAANVQGRNWRPPNGILLAPRFLCVEGFCVAAVIILQFGPNPARLILFLALIMWAIKSTRGLVQSLSLSVLVVEANQGLAAAEPQVSLLKWLLIFVCFVRIAQSRDWRNRKWPAWALGFAVFVGVTTILGLFVSYDRMLSGFKLTSFAAGAVAALLGVASDNRPFRYWINWFFTVHCVVVVLSVPMLFLSSGYFVKAGSFQGILNHPQAFGVYLSIWDSYLIVHLLTSRRVNVFLLLIVALTTYFIIASNCRTAVLAMATSAVLSGLAAIVPRRPGLNYLNLQTVTRVCVIGSLAVGILVYDSSRVHAAILDFAKKGYNAGVDDPIDLLAGSFQDSRGGIVRTLVQSIAEHPLGGVGFGLAPSDVGQVIGRDPLLGLPVTAPTEEGFLPLSVMSQVGIIGALVLGGFLVQLAVPIVKFAPLPILAMFITALMVNIGEMIFFAIGGLGLYMWLILALCYECSVCEGRRIGDRAQQGVGRGLLIGAWRKGIRNTRRAIREDGAE